MSSPRTFSTRPRAAPLVTLERIALGLLACAVVTAIFVGDAQKVVLAWM